MVVDVGAGIPLGSTSLEPTGGVYRQLWQQGYRTFWTGEVDGPDGFAPLMVGAAALPEGRFGTAIVSPFLRGPALLAMSAASVATAAPGRFVLGIGPGSARIIEDWNGGQLVDPFGRVRDTVRFLRAAFTGAKVDETYDTFAVRGFRLSLVPEVAPPILVAALRPGMLRFGAEEADGVILNWVSPDDVRTSLAATGPQGEVACRIYVSPGVERADALVHARRLTAVYLNVPAYAAQQRWLGRSTLLAEVWARWERGDRRGAAAAIPDEVIDELFVFGTPAECDARIRQYLDAGVTSPIITTFPLDVDPLPALGQLSPATIAGNVTG